MAKGKIVAQCKLDSDGKTMTAWLDPSRIRVGSIVTLKGIEYRWTVVSMGEPRSAAGIHDDFHAGGL